MIDAILYAIVAFFILVAMRDYGRFCFRLGYRKGKLASINHINVLCTTTGNDYVFSDLITETFLLQVKDYDVGVAELKKRYPGKTLIVSRT